MGEFLQSTGNEEDGVFLPLAAQILERRSHRDTLLQESERLGGLHSWQPTHWQRNAETRPRWQFAYHLPTDHMSPPPSQVRPKAVVPPLQSMHLTQDSQLSACAVLVQSQRTQRHHLPDLASFTPDKAMRTQPKMHTAREAGRGLASWTKFPTAARNETYPAQALMVDPAARLLPGPEQRQIEKQYIRRHRRHHPMAYQLLAKPGHRAVGEMERTLALQKEAVILRPAYRPNLQLSITLTLSLLLPTPHTNPSRAIALVQVGVVS